MAACDWHVIFSVFISNHVVPCFSVNSQPAQQLFVPEERANKGKIKPAQSHTEGLRGKSWSCHGEQKYLSSQHWHWFEGVNSSSPLFLPADYWTFFFLFLPAHGVQHESGRHSGGALRKTAGEAEDALFHRGGNGGGTHWRRWQRCGAREKRELHLSTVLALCLFCIQGKKKKMYFYILPPCILTSHPFAEYPPIVSTSITAAKDISPDRKAGNLWPLHWGHFDTITSITWLVVSLRRSDMTNGLCADWDGLCVSVSLCVQIGLSGVKEGLSAAGGDSALLSVNLWASGAHTQTHTHTGFFKKINIACIKHVFVLAVYVSRLKAWLLCIVALVYVFVGLPAALFSCLCLVYVPSHLLLHWSAYAPLVRADSCSILF